MSEKPENPLAFASQGAMTLRDYFAAAALQGFLANSNISLGTKYCEYAIHAYGAADAILKMRQS